MELKGQGRLFQDYYNREERLIQTALKQTNKKNENF